MQSSGFQAKNPMFGNATYQTCSDCFRPVRERTAAFERPTELSLEASVDKSLRFSQGPLVQLGILGFGLLEGGDIRVGVPPKSKEISIGGRGFGRVSDLGVGSSNLQGR